MNKEVLWSPCETFSTVRRSNIGRNGYTKESIYADMIERGVPILRKTQEIIEYFQPKTWFLQNPQTGLMKNYIDPSIPFYDVDYCKYTDWGYRKRTRIWYGGIQNRNFIISFYPSTFHLGFKKVSKLKQNEMAK